jgi:hypothetical protein
MTPESALLPSLPALVTLSPLSFEQQPFSSKETAMKNPLDSLWGTVISGLVLTLVLYQIVNFALK